VSAAIVILQFAKFHRFKFSDAAIPATRGSISGLWLRKPHWLPGIDGLDDKCTAGSFFDGNK